MISLVSIALLPTAATVALAPVRAPSAPEIDGKLDESVWTTAPVSTSFTQKTPDDGSAPVETTSVRVAYDDDAVYFGIDCAQRLSPVVQRLTRRDGDVEADYVAIDLDTRRDGQSAFHFQVNAAGVLVDGIRHDDTALNLEWDDNWEAATAATSTGWSSEIRIPLRVLRFSDTPSQTWGMQVRRYVSRRQELDEWAHIPRTVAGEVSRYGSVGPFGTLAESSPVEIRPFALGRVRLRDLPGDSNSADLGGWAGVDAKWHVSSDLTLDLAVTPDFGQVEADQLVLNLGSFETFFPEKRPFFLEGSELFATPLQPVYTRRIGRAPSDPALPAGESVTDDPPPAPIYGAAKLTGRVQQLSVAALSAVTGPSSAEVNLADGSRAERTAEPYAMYNALRVRRDLGDRGYLGVLGGTTLRFESGADYPIAIDPMTGEMATLCPSGLTSVTADCIHDAYVGGADGAWRSPEGDIALSGQILGSVVSGGPPRVLRDGTQLESGDSGFGGRVRVAKEGGNFIGEFFYETESPRLELNDLGFADRQNQHRFWFAAAHRIAAPWGPFLEHRTQIEIFHRRNWDGLQLPSGYQINSSGRLRNFWSYFIELHYRPAYFDDREIGNGVALERGGVWGLELEGETDPRYPVSASLATTTQLVRDGFVFDGSSRVTFRILPQLDLALESGFTHTFGEPRFVEEEATDDYLFARLRATSLDAVVRGTYTFHPQLTLQAFVQTFLASVRFSEFSSDTSGSREIQLASLEPAAAPDESPDFAEAALNATVVLRWEYRLGSTLFAVYSRAQDPSVALGADPASFRWSDIGKGRSTDVVLLKLAYWWN